MVLWHSYDKFARTNGPRTPHYPTTIDDMFEEVGNSFKCWMTLLVHYEPVNPTDETHKGFDAYLSAAPTRISKRFGIVSGWANPYRFALEALTD